MRRAALAQEAPDDAGQEQAAQQVDMRITKRRSHRPGSKPHQGSARLDLPQHLFAPIRQLQARAWAPYRAACAPAGHRRRSRAAAPTHCSWPAAQPDAQSGATHMPFLEQRIERHEQVEIDGPQAHDLDIDMMISIDQQSISG